LSLQAIDLEAVVAARGGAVCRTPGVAGSGSSGLPACRLGANPRWGRPNCAVRRDRDVRADKRRIRHVSAATQGREVRATRQVGRQLSTTMRFQVGRADRAGSGATAFTVFLYGRMIDAAPETTTT